ncbi:MAG: hypothetical protein H0W81_08085 [Chloroflexi bacterium]|nr:hypothetical protein [Chloroflexota bacterium]
MPRLDAGGRKGLRDTAFACVDPQGRRRLAVDLGEHHLRGIGGHGLFQVSAADLPGEFPPLRILPAIPT